VAEIFGTSGAATGAGTAGSGAAFVLAVALEEELGEAKERGASGPSIIIEMMRQTIMVFEV